MIFIPFDLLGIIFLIIILLAIAGVDLIISHLYGIVIVLIVFLGLCFFITEIVNAISKRRPIYILNALLGGVFYVIAFELIYETISLINGSVQLLKSIIIYVVISVILTVIIQCSHNCEKRLNYRFLSVIHSILIIAMAIIIPFVGMKQYFHKQEKSVANENGLQLEVLENAPIYLEVDLSSGHTFSYSWYPMDIKIPAGTLKKGSKVYYDGDEYVVLDDWHWQKEDNQFVYRSNGSTTYYKVTDGERMGYVEKYILLNISNFPPE